MDIQGSLLKSIPVELIKKYRILPLEYTDQSITVAMITPFDPQVVDDLSQLTGKRIIPKAMDAVEIDHGIRRFYVHYDVADSYLETNNLSELAPGYGLDNQVNSFIKTLLTKAVTERASDIHFEPEEKGWRVRFRIDGNLVELMKPESITYSRVISRLKILAELDIAQKRQPQEGSFHQTITGKNIDLRLVTMPTLYGEKVVIRILDGAAIDFSMDKLGFSPDNLSMVQRLLKNPFGLILVTGPTGSGKTTTLYSMLRELQVTTKSITTLEDPVEYTLPGITQIPVNQDSGITYAQGLKYLLRQDPDIIMIGEIRELETARIALRAAITGHFVIASIHTSSAPQAISRLLDLEVEPYLIEAGLVGVMSQRLVRLKCSCKTKCVICNYTGYYGRTSIQEVLELSTALKSLINHHFDEAIFTSQATAEGYVTLEQTGDVLCNLGITDKAELARVIYCP